MNNKLIGNNIVFYTDEEGNTNIEVILQNEDVWLNAQAIAELFEITDKVVYKHIKNIYNQEELEETNLAKQNDDENNNFVDEKDKDDELKFKTTYDEDNTVSDGTKERNSKWDDFVKGYDDEEDEPKPKKKKHGKRFL